eukprot:1256481-Alexandrium_andersonii.AAC.1
MKTPSSAKLMSLAHCMGGPRGPSLQQGLPEWARKGRSRPAWRSRAWMAINTVVATAVKQRSASGPPGRRPWV